MPHRAKQVIDALEAKLEANGTFGARVYQQRAVTLSEDAQELPAACLFYGDDNAVGDLGALNMAFIDSLLDVTVAVVAAGSTEQDLLDALLEYRRQVHVALMADEQQGLPAIVVGTRYGGAAAPQITTTGGRLVGRIETRWAVHYRTNFSDPA